MRTPFKVALGLVGLLVIWGIVASGPAEESASSSTRSTERETPASSAAPVSDDSDAEEETIEWKLAVIHSGNNSLAKGDSLVSEFSDLIDSIQAKTTNTRTEISDMTVFTWQESEAMGYPDSLLQTMRNLDNSMPAGSDDLDFAEIAAVYLTLLEAG
jgi:hypothetical protein